jgi:N-acetylneuraminate synthase
VELGEADYLEIDEYCKQIGIPWFASCWDEDAVDFVERLSPPCYKVPSAMLTNHHLLQTIAATGRPVILSTGMSLMDQIREATKMLPTDRLLIAHCTSTYPCPPEQLNLRMIQTLQKEFDCPIGYSGHEVGLPTTVAAVALGACFVERHITLDRGTWGSDQAASVEPGGIERLVKYIRVVEAAMGKGTKEIYASELPIMRRLRLEDTTSLQGRKTGEAQQAQ